MSDTNQPEVSEMSDQEESDLRSRSRSRSQSRRARRKKAAKNQQNKKNEPMPSVPEDDQQASSQSSAQAPNGASAQSSASSSAPQKPPTVEETGMQPFEWIGPDETSMNGPVTYARAQRGEIPARPGNPNQSLVTGTGEGASKGAKDPMDYDGLKLRLDLNLDIEIELKARIQGDLTLALILAGQNEGEVIEFKNFGNCIELKWSEVVMHGDHSNSYRPSKESRMAD